MSELLPDKPSTAAGDGDPQAARAQLTRRTAPRVSLLQRCHDADRRQGNATGKNFRPVHPTNRVLSISCIAPSRIRSGGGDFRISSTAICGTERQEMGLSSVSQMHAAEGRSDQSAIAFLFADQHGAHSEAISLSPCRDGHDRQSGPLRSISSQTGSGR